jgi:hypothetical protein
LALSVSDQSTVTTLTETTAKQGGDSTVSCSSGTGDAFRISLVGEVEATSSISLAQSKPHPGQRAARASHSSRHQSRRWQRRRGVQIYDVVRAQPAIVTASADEGNSAALIIFLAAVYRTASRLLNF